MDIHGTPAPVGGASRGIGETIAAAIVAYLECRRNDATTSFEREAIDAGLDTYRRERAGPSGR